MGGKREGKGREKGEGKGREKGGEAECGVLGKGKQMRC